MIVPNGEKRHQIENGNLQLLAWTISGKSYLRKKFQRKLSSLSQMPEDQLQTLNRSRPGLSRVAAVLADKLIQLKVLLTSDLNFLTYCFHEGCEYNTIAGF